jgi:hypothetical protein
VRSLVSECKLSYRDMVSMMNERGIFLAHTTILRWVQHYTPERWQRYAHAVGGSWRTDVPLPGRRQKRENRRFLFEPETGRERPQWSSVALN